MEFCPSCGNMLLFELPKMEFSSRLCCPTCPYICHIANKVKIQRHQHLVRKPIDFIFTDDDRKNLNKTSGVSCPDCDHGEATFTQVQTRSADEPMTVFYTCTKCKHTWTEN